MNCLEVRREDLQVLRVEPDDPLDAGAGSLLEEAGTLVLVSQRAEERFVLQLPDDADINRCEQHHEGARKL